LLIKKKKKKKKKKREKKEKEKERDSKKKTKKEKKKGVQKKISLFCASKISNCHIPSNSNMKKIPYSLCPNLKFLN
jgi:hypothetical protein